MGTIITVHGTFAHAAAAATGTMPWWRPESSFARELTAAVGCEGGESRISAFQWSGENSVTERRRAGHELFKQLDGLEKSGEPYCLIAHSHGGSVVSAALLEAAARKRPLPHLKRWVTVGTPFIELRPERFLFLRLPLFYKAVYVASLMLFVILLGAIIGGLGTGELSLANPAIAWRAGAAAVLSSLPFALFYLVAYLRERRTLFQHRPKVKARAQAYFESRWLPLTHEDDEAVRGLASLRKVDVPIFDREFAVPVLSLVSVFILPLLYLLAVNSPTLMMGLADKLRSDVYQVTRQERARALQRSRSIVRDLRAEIADQRKITDDTLAPLHERDAAEREIAKLDQRLQDVRTDLHQSYPDLPQLQRSVRFQRRFLERDGRLCNGGRLCGEGRDVGLNARLLLHLVTDEAVSLFIDDEVRRSTVGRTVRFLVPVVLVPVVFGIAAILIVMLVQVIARIFSVLASRWLDRITWRQVRRTAYGIDTEDEVAVAAAPGPVWVRAKRPFLPGRVSDAITEHANQATFQSLGKFRNAISELAHLERVADGTETIADYLSWNELIHTTYFHVPDVSRIIASAISRESGFKPTTAFDQAGADSDLDRWLGTHAARPHATQEAA